MISKQSIAPRERNRKKPAVITPEQNERAVRIRIVIAVGVIALLYAGWLSRAFQLQILDHARLLREAEANYLKSIVFDTRRGDLLDRNGVVLAKSISADTVIANPRLVKDRERTAKLLSEMLTLPLESLLSRLNSRRYYVYIKRQVTSIEARRVRRAKLPGIFIKQESKRYYPERDLASQILGIVGVDSKGLEGVELEFNAPLLGEVQRVKVIRDWRNKTSLTDETVSTERLSGRNVVLAIDAKIQRYVEQQLKEAVLNSRATSGMAVVLDPNSGELLAVANYPSFNPNSFTRFDRNWWRNRALTDVYEPGSTFKILTLAAALETKSVTLNDIIDTEGGRMRIGRYVIHDTHPSDRFSVLDCMKHSSNICMAKVADRIGKKAFFDFIKRFGVGSVPGTRFPGETAGMVLPLKKWGQIHLANIAFGQGIATSAVQLAQIVAVIANGGFLVKPVLAKRILDADGHVVQRLDGVQRKRVISETTAALVKRAMVAVMQPGGTGQELKFEYYDVAGKTGTSQKKNPDGPGYSEDLWIGSMTGFAPVDKPRIVVAVVIDEPLDKHYGSVVAGPAFRAITEWTLRYLGVPPTRQKPFSVVKLQKPERDRSYVPRVRPRPRVAPRRPLELIAQNGPADLSKVIVPDFGGLSMDSVRKLASRRGLDIEYVDHGFSTQQSIAPYTRVAKGSRIRVVFKLEDK
ncbi:MAG: transpeptidase family protein [Myxococcales bacterium]|nr:transpeptidase family protein [Myxococcales bacterium]